MVVTTDLLYPGRQVNARISWRATRLTSPSPADQPIDAGRALYGISVAAELVGSAPQNLRLYEARGLLNPARSAGGTRRYSNEDLTRLREIGRLLDAGLNLAGITAVLELQAANRSLQEQLDEERRRTRPQRPAK